MPRSRPQDALTARGDPAAAAIDGEGQPRVFKQQRAERTYEALLHAAVQVFARRGFEAAQTPEIAAAAGVSVGAFYRYFADKRAIFVELVGQHLRQAEDEVLGKLTPDRFLDADPRAAIEVVLGVLFDRVRRDVDFERVYLALSLSDPEIAAMRARYEERGTRRMAQLIAEVVPRSLVPYPDAAARVISVAALEVACERAGLRPRYEAAGDGEVAHELREMLFRYLFATPVGATAGPSASTKTAASSMKAAEASAPMKAAESSMRATEASAPMKATESSVKAVESSTLAKASAKATRETAKATRETAKATRETAKATRETAKASAGSAASAKAAAGRPAALAKASTSRAGSASAKAASPKTASAKAVSAKAASPAAAPPAKAKPAGGATSAKARARGPRPASKTK